MEAIARNDYHIALNNYVSEVYKGTPGYTWKGFFNYKPEIIPLDLSAYPIPTEMAAFINRYFDTETTDRNGNYMLKAFDPGRNEYALADKLGVIIREANGYNFWGVNEDAMLSYSWTEGDVYLTLFNDKAKFEQEIRETEDWYAKEA
mgnify:FL=1